MVAFDSSLEELFHDQLLKRLPKDAELKPQFERGADRSGWIFSPLSMIAGSELSATGKNFTIRTGMNGVMP